MAYDIQDYDELQIYVTDGWREWYIPKFRIFMTVEEPICYLYWTDTEKGASGLTRLLALDYNDVTFGYLTPSSASEVEIQIDGYIVSAWTNIPIPPTPDLDTVLTAGNDGGGLEITNIADGTADTSAATVGQLREVNYGIAYSGTVTHSQNETSARALVSFTIPAGTLEVGDMVMIEFVTRKTSGSGSNTFQCKVNSAAGTGGTILAQYSQTAIQSFNGLGRFLVTGASSEIGWAAINGNAYGVAAVDTTSITLPIANDIYINMVNQKNTGTDLFDLRAANVRIVKYRP